MAYGFCSLRISRALSSATVPISSSSFTWDDVLEIGLAEDASPQNSSSDLTGFLDKVDRCNRGSEKLAEFIPFVIEEQVVGYTHKPEDRTRAVADVIKILGDKGIIPGIRNELYPVKPSFNAHVYFSLERAAAPYFGLKNAGWTPVPQFGGWDQKGPDATNYSVVFSKARANRKLNKAGIRHSSLGSEQELMASARHPHQHLHHRHATQDDDPVMKKKRILTYINCCIRPN